MPGECRLFAEVSALLGSLCPITDVTARKRHRGGWLALQGLTSLCLSHQHLPGIFHLGTKVQS